MRSRLPVWFKKKIPSPAVMSEMDGLFSELHLHTICESALCPNIGECFTGKTATFLVLGNICTRNCTFCAVEKGQPGPVDPSEVRHISEAVEKLGLKYVVLTSVTRDDLSDGGAEHFAAIIRQLKSQPHIKVEVLVPDFRGSRDSLQAVLAAGPDVLNHNVETVPRLYPDVRPQADFQRSVHLLAQAKEILPGIITKSGIMVGLGETEEELLEAMRELREAGCDLLTIGQYLQPSLLHHGVVKFIPPDKFEEYARLGRDMGFREVASAPLVRSSFHAAELFTKASTR